MVKLLHVADDRYINFLHVAVESINEENNKTTSANAEGRNTAANAEGNILSLRHPKSGSLIYSLSSNMLISS